MFEGMDMNALMAQAQKMQQDLMAAQEEHQAREFTGTAGGDAVKLVLTGDGQLNSLTLDPSVVDPEDTETLSDLIIAAFRSAKDQADESIQGLMPDLPGGGGGMPQGLGF